MPKTKKQKHEEGVIRNEAHSKLTIQQKIDLAKSRRGESKKEIERLTKKLEEQKHKKEK